MDAIKQQIWVNIGSGNNCTKPFPEPMLTIINEVFLWNWKKNIQKSFHNAWCNKLYQHNDQHFADNIFVNIDYFLFHRSN